MACEICHKTYVSSTEDDEFDPDTKPHVCTTCGQSFSLKIQLKRHTLLHANGESFVCVKCSKDNGNQESKTYNLRLSKKCDGYTCDVCEEVFGSNRALLRHTSKEHAFEKFYDCDDCSESFDSSHDLKKHSEIHKTKVSYKRKTSAKYDSDEMSPSNSLLEKSKNLSCQICSKSFAYQACLDKHIKSYKCVIPPISVKKEGHKKKKKSKPEYDDDSSEDNDKKHVCGVCGKRFTRKSALEGHEVFHFKDDDDDSPEEEINDSDDYICEEKKPKLSEINIKKSYTCEHCNFVCFSKQTLDKHMKNHEENEDETRSKKEEKNNRHVCNKCHKSFFLEYELERHLEIHLKKETDKKAKNNDIVEMQCEICSKVFHSKSRLRKHLLFHIDDNNDDVEVPKKWQTRKNKDFECDVCGKKFAGETCLSKHMKKHEEDSAEESSGHFSRSKKRKQVETLICEFCKEEFTGRKGSYIKHIHAHTPEVCGICDERFVDRQGLREHCKIHVGTEEGRMFMECSQKALDAKNGILPPEPKVEYIYLVVR